jgi:hypothetical protein
MNFSVVIEDIGVRLPGRGSSFIVHSDAASVSKDLVLCKNWVKVEQLKDEPKMPVWPFTKVKKPTPDPTPIFVKDLDEIKSSVKKISEYIESLLQRPVPVAPEIVAEHVRVLQQRERFNSVLSGRDNEKKSSFSEPIFVASQIVPDDVESDIRANKAEVDKQDLDEGTKAIRKLRGKKPKQK